jgi:transcriptional regulator with XRE-family HTH domain
MPSVLAQAIRDARLAAGLTQEQLGRRLGLKGRAIYRWERDENGPTKRNRAALIAAINAVNRQAAAKLAVAIEGEGGDGAVATAAPAPQPAAPAISAPVALELALLGMADELDLPPRRVRGSLVRLLKRLGEANLSLETTRRQLEAWITGAQ